MILRIIRAVMRLLPPRAPEIIYTLFLRPRPLRAVTNRILVRLIPASATVEGMTLYLNPDDPVLSPAVAFGIYENYERELFRSFCRPGDTVVDIGANVGLYTVTAAACAGKVIAIEPDPESFRYLQKTLDSNRLSQVTAVNAAAGDSRRIVSLFLTKDNKADGRIYNSSGDRQEVKVRMVDLDSLLEGHGILNLQVIKMDIQGAEALALRGMRRTLANNPDLVIFAEFWPWGIAQTGIAPAAFLAELRQAGFRFYAIDEENRKLDKIPDLGQFIAQHENLQYTGTNMQRSHANLICVGPGRVLQ